MSARGALGIALAGAGALTLLNVQRFDWSSDSSAASCCSS